MGRGAALALGAGVLGGVAGVVSYLLMTSGYENGRTLKDISMAVMFGGLFVFGLIALRAKPMPRGNALPALAGVWFPAITLADYVNAPITGQALNVPFWLSFALFAAMSFLLAWLGYVLQSETRTEHTLA